MGDVVADGCFLCADGGGVLRHHHDRGGLDENF